MMLLLFALGAAAPPPPAPSSAGVELRDEGVVKGTARVLNCTGAGISCSLLDAGFGTIDVSSGGGGGAPTTAQYWVGAADGTLSAEKNLGALSTGLIINTAGTPSAYAGAACGANQYVTSTSASGALTCSQVATSQLSGTITNAQLASSYSGVGACTNQFARTLNANAAPTCATVALSTDTSGTLAIGRGGTGQTTITTNQVYVGTALDTLTAKTLPSCSNATTSKLLYDNSTQAFSCGTDQTGGGGGTSPLILSFGGF